MDKPVEPVPTPPPLAAHEFVEQPRSLDELRLRPNFRAPLKVTSDVKLIDLLTPYRFDVLEPCGLADCKTKHFKGYLAITSTGAETNIGHICGKKAFGVDYEHAEARFKRSEDRRVTIERALDLQSQAPRIKQRIRELANRPYGIRWVYALRAAVKTVIGRQGFDHLNTRAFREDYKVVVVQEIPPKEDSRDKRPKYVHAPIGTLAPMEWLAWDYRQFLFKEVKDEFAFFAELSPTQMEMPELKKRLKNLAGWEHQIGLAEAACSQGVPFLALDNLRLVDLAMKEMRRKRPANPFLNVRA